MAHQVDNRAGSPPAAPAPSKTRSFLRPVSDRRGLLVAPGVLFLLLAFALPIIIMIQLSLTEPSPENYTRFITAPGYLSSLIYTLLISLGVTVICVVIGYPYAYLMAHAGRRERVLLIALVLIPFWTSALVRTYAWTVILRPSGLINNVLLELHLIDEPLTLMNNTFGVVIGMTHVMMPFMVLPMFAAMSRIDGDFVSAARGLGASPWTAFRKVYWRLSLPGVLAGALLVFVLNVGFYITPAVLGSQRQPMFSQLLVTVNNELFDSGFASALAMILLVVTIVVVWLSSRVVRLGDAFGYEEENRP